MEMPDRTLHENATVRSHTLRDLVAILFRHYRLMVLAFVGVLTGAVVVAVLQSNHYQAHMKILVKRERVDPVVTAQSSTIAQASTPVSEEELNSEAELRRARMCLKRS